MDNIETKIKEAAQCLMGICDDWDIFDIEQFLDWQLDHLDELPEGYPREVMTREYEAAIILKTESMIKKAQQPPKPKTTCKIKY